MQKALFFFGFLGLFLCVQSQSAPIPNPCEYEAIKSDIRFWMQTFPLGQEVEGDFFLELQANNDIALICGHCPSTEQDKFLIAQHDPRYAELYQKLGYGVRAAIRVVTDTPLLINSESYLYQYASELLEVSVAGPVNPRPEVIANIYEGDPVNYYGRIESVEGVWLHLKLVDGQRVELNLGHEARFYNNLSSLDNVYVRGQLAVVGDLITVRAILAGDRRNFVDSHLAIDLLEASPSRLSKIREQEQLKKMHFAQIKKLVHERQWQEARQVLAAFDLFEVTELDIAILKKIFARASWREYPAFLQAGKILPHPLFALSRKQVNLRWPTLSAPEMWAWAQRLPEIPDLVLPKSLYVLLDDLHMPESEKNIRWQDLFQKVITAKISQAEAGDITAMYSMSAAILYYADTRPGPEAAHLLLKIAHKYADNPHLSESLLNDILESFTQMARKCPDHLALRKILQDAQIPLWSIYQSRGAEFIERNSFLWVKYRNALRATGQDEILEK